MIDSDCQLPSVCILSILSYFQRWETKRCTRYRHPCIFT